jgi:hypothetical protein
VSAQVITSLIAVISILLSAASLVIAYKAYRNTLTYQKIDYEVLLELVDEVLIAKVPLRENQTVTGAIGDGLITNSSEPLAIPRSLAADEVLKYRAKLANKGKHPVRVSSVQVVLSAQDDTSKTLKKAIDVESVLEPGSNRSIGCTLANRDLEEFRRKFGVVDCTYSLEFMYFTATGEPITATRHLGGSNILVLQHYSRLLERQSTEGSSSRTWSISFGHRD